MRYRRWEPHCWVCGGRMEEGVLLVIDTYTPGPYPGAYICFVIAECAQRSSQ